MTSWNPFSRPSKKVAVQPAETPQGVLDLSTKAGRDNDEPDLLLNPLARSLQRTIADIPVVTQELITADSAAATSVVTRIGDNFSGGIETQAGSMSPTVAGWYASQGFIGHQMCAIIAQQWLVGKACSMPAEDALRNGWEVDFKGVEDTAKIEDLTNKLHELDKRMKIDNVMFEAAKFANVFGIRILIPIIESTDKDYYRKPFNIDGVTAGAFRGWTQIDPQWIYPLLDSVGAGDPNSPEFYEPTYWIAGGVQYHRSHLVILKTEEPADILKPTYLFAGIPLTQRIAERVYAAERTANEAPLLAMSKRTTSLKVDLTKAKLKLNSFLTRLQEWITFRDNYQVKVLGKDEELNETDTSLADLDVVIMTQYQLVSAIAKVPATKLLGTSPKGFNATGDHEIKSYHEYLESIQSSWFDRFLERHYLLMSRAYLGGVEVDHTWLPVDSVGAEAAATIQKMKADTGAVLIDKGVISPDEERSRLRMDKDSGYTLSDDVEAPQLPEPTPPPGQTQPTEEQPVGEGDEAESDGGLEAAAIVTALAALAVQQPTTPSDVAARKKVVGIVGQLVKALSQEVSDESIVAQTAKPGVEGAEGVEEFNSEEVKTPAPAVTVPEAQKPTAAGKAALDLSMPKVKGPVAAPKIEPEKLKPAENKLQSAAISEVKPTKEAKSSAAVKPSVSASTSNNVTTEIAPSVVVSTTAGTEAAELSPEGPAAESLAPKPPAHLARKPAATTAAKPAVVNSGLETPTAQKPATVEAKVEPASTTTSVPVAKAEKPDAVAPSVKTELVNPVDPTTEQE